MKTMELQKFDAAKMLENVITKGDLKDLSPQDRVLYYKEVCESVGLNPLTKPFEYITLNGKQTLYALKGATDQLRHVHGVSVEITSRERIDDIYVVSVKARDKQGRQDASIGAVNVAGLKGDALANAFMKAETKAKRRVTLSICGLGMLDETEVSDIPEVKVSRQTNVIDVASERTAFVKKFHSLVEELAIGQEVLDKWLLKAGVRAFEEMPLEVLERCTNYLLKKKKEAA
jgi:hypothetical protein